MRCEWLLGDLLVRGLNGLAQAVLNLGLGREGRVEHADTTRHHGDGQLVLLLKKLEDLAQSLLAMDIKAIPQRPRHAAILLLRSWQRLAEAEKGQREIGKAVAEGRQGVALDDLVELEKNQASNKGRRGRNGRDDLAGNQLGLVAIRRLDLVRGSAQVGRRRNEIHVEVCVVVLLKVADGQLHAREVRRRRERSNQALQLALLRRLGGALLGRLLLVGLDVHAALGLELGDVHLADDLEHGVARDGALELECVRAQIRGSNDEVDVQLVVGVEDNGVRAALVARPERHALVALAGHLVRREVEEQLHDLVVEEILEAQTSPLDAVRKVDRFVQHEAVPDRVDSLNRVAAGLLQQALDVARLAQILVDHVWRLLEQALKEVTGPLQSVLDEVREVLEGADRDRLLWRILRRRVRLRQVRQHNLGIALGAEGARLQQRPAVEDTALVHVASGLDVVKRVGNTVDGTEELVAVDGLSLGADTRGACLDVQRRVHLRDGSGRALGLQLVDIVGPEEELAVEVRLLDGVHVSDDQLAMRARSKPDHGHVLQQLTADGASTDHKPLLVAQALLEVLAEDGDLRVVARADGLQLLGGDGVDRQRLKAVEVQVLHDGHELATAGLHDLLRHDAADHGADRRQICRRLRGQGREHLLVELVNLVGRGIVDRLDDLQIRRNVRRIAGSRKVPLLGLEGVQRAVAQVQQRRAVELGHVHVGKRRRVQRIGQGFEFDCLGHLDLRGAAATDVVTEAGRVADGKRIRAKDLDGTSRRLVELGHALDLDERHVVAVLEAVALLVKDRHHALALLGDRGDQDADGLLAVGVAHVEALAKVAEDLAEQAARVGNNEGDALRMGDVADLSLLLERRLGEDDNLELGDKLLREGSRACVNRHIGVQLSKMGSRGLRAVAFDVLLREVVLRSEIHEGHLLRVLDANRLDTTEDNILCNLDTKTREPGNENIRAIHLAHRLMAKHIELARVQALVNRVRRGVHGDWLLTLSHVHRLHRTQSFAVADPQERYPHTW
eukprot:m.84068 g.84068  ORF g.84068 m.84068 type:complete len:1015 (-) comp8186_c0_seq2:29-3073(-)